MDCQVFSATEFVNIEKMIWLCAQSALHATKGRLYNASPLNGVVRADAELISKLLACYKSSSYADVASPYYYQRIERLFRDIAENKLPFACYNQAHYDLILPVMMFYYIMHNESNLESANARANDNEKHLEAGQADIPWTKKFPNKPESCKIPREVRNTASFSKHISVEKEYAQNKKLDSNDLIPDHIKQACTGIFELENEYAQIKLCSEYARAGVFLHDLLKCVHNDKKPLDTILRLYMVAELHDVLTSTRFLIRGEAYVSTKMIGRPLVQYANESRACLESSFDQPYPIQYANDGVPKRMTKFLHQSKTKQQKFINFYQHLSEDYIFEIPDILDFFLAKDILQPCIGIDEAFKNYVSEVNKLLENLPYLTETLKTAQAVTRMVNLFREDKYELSWQNSDDYANLQIAKEIIDSRIT